jgi:hypothetical protein
VNEKLFDKSKHNPVSSVFIFGPGKKNETERSVVALTKQESHEWVREMAGLVSFRVQALACVCDQQREG